MKKDKSLFSVEFLLSVAIFILGCIWLKTDAAIQPVKSINHKYFPIDKYGNQITPFKKIQSNKN